jgi:hypothetical protein
MNQTTTQPSRRKGGPRGVRKATEREKCTLCLDRDTSIKLSVAAHLRGLDRSELVNELLSEALRYVVISLRATSNGSASLDAGISQGEIAAA